MEMNLEKAEKMRNRLAVIADLLDEMYEDLDVRWSELCTKVNHSWYWAMTARDMLSDKIEEAKREEE